MLLKRKDPISKSYDVIIIGSGLAGMTAANRLGKLGRKVLLLESHNKLGGFATWFRRPGGHVFDVSLHGFPVGMKKTCRKYWNKDIAEKIVQLEDIRFVNPQFNIKTDFTKKDYKNILCEKFGLNSEEVESFFADLGQMNFYDNDPTTNRELFQKYFPDRNDVVRFLLEPITYANGSDLNDPAITYGIVFSNFMNKGVYTFKGGTDNLIAMMKEELLKNNVDIKLNTKVQKILIDNKRAKGVMVKDQEVFAPVVISNSGIKNTINSLVGKEYFDADFLTETEAIRINSSSCQVYMGIKAGESIPHIGDLIFTSTHETYDWEKVLSDDVSSRTFSVYYPDTRPDSESPRYTIVCSTNALWKDWHDLDDEEYESKKQRLIDSTLKELEKLIPGVTRKIDFLEAATPRTVKKFTLHEMGSSFGTKFEGLQVSRELPNKIHGLFHAGSVGIIMSGWLGAANYGVIVSNEVESILYKREKSDFTDTKKDEVSHEIQC